MSGTAVAAFRFWAGEGAATITGPEGEARGALVACGEAGRSVDAAAAVGGVIVVAPLGIFSAVLRFLRRGVVGLLSGLAAAEGAGTGTGSLRNGFVVFAFRERFFGAGASALAGSLLPVSSDTLTLVGMRAERLRVVVDMLRMIV